MAKWTVSVDWDVEVEAEDEGDALMQADRMFDFIGEARTEEIESDVIE